MAMGIALIECPARHLIRCYSLLADVCGRSRYLPYLSITKREEVDLALISLLVCALST